MKYVEDIKTILYNFFFFQFLWLKSVMKYSNSVRFRGVLHFIWSLLFVLNRSAYLPCRLLLSCLL